MKTRTLILSLLLAAFPAISAVAADSPNIIVILADDLGPGDLSCTYPEARVKTPRIDKLAREGITFTDAHSGSAVCSPTRYGLLTGRYAWRTKILTEGVLGTYSPHSIDADRLTLPAMLKQKGYHTAAFGKWHLGCDWPQGRDNADFSKPIAGPTARGFDTYFGVDAHNYPPFCFIENDHTVGLPTARTTERIAGQQPGGAMLPGWKLDEVLPRIAERAVAHIGERARARQPFFLYFALTSVHAPLVPSANFKGKSGQGELGDSILEMDAVVGQVLDALESNGIAKNTLVIYSADNGPTSGNKGRTAGFRANKGAIYEGGHRVPFFARWPGRIPAGATSDETLCLTDLMATCAAIVGAKLPERAGEDSYNMLPALLNEKRKAPIREATVHQAKSGQLAIRQGPWKLCEKFDASGQHEAAPRELFNLAQDPGESKEVSSANADVVAKLSALLEKYRRDGRSRPASQ